MAILNTVNLDNGLTIENAFLQISNFSGDHDILHFNVSVYMNESAYQDGKPSITTLDYSMDYDKDRNLYKQMYNHLHNLPEYEDAIEA